MQTMKPEDTRRIHVLYAIANTPAFLFDRLRLDPAVAELRKQIPAGELLEAAVLIAADPNRTSEGLSNAYAFLAALDSRSRSALSDARIVTALEGLSWGSYFLERATRSSIVASRTELSAPAVLEGIRTTCHHSTNRMDFGGPRV